MSPYDDTQISDTPCPKCGHEITKYNNCTACFGEGFFDESDEEFCTPGTIMVPCLDCHGTGMQQWCPSCGYELLPGERGVDHYFENKYPEF